MLSVKAIDINNNVINLDTPLKIIINQDVDVPSDDLAITFSYIENIPELKEIYVTENNEYIFRGVVDEQQTISDLSGAYTKIVARNFASILLDNESKSYSYTNLSSEVIFNNHVKPYGFDKYKGEDVILPGAFNVPKGISNWQVLCNFTMKAYGKRPAVELDGTVNFCGVENENIIIFSNNSGLSYSSIKENYKRFSPLSAVYVKTMGDTGYNVEIKNKEAESKGIKRERFVDVTNGVSTMATVNKMIDNSNLKSYEIQLVCPYRLLGVLGAEAKVEDELINSKDRLYVRNLRYVLSSQGEYTNITLERKC